MNNNKGYIVQDNEEMDRSPNSVDFSHENIYMKILDNACFLEYSWQWEDGFQIEEEACMDYFWDRG